VINKLGIHHLREKERKTPGPVISRTSKEKSNLIKRRFVSKTFQKQTHFLSVFFLVLFLKSSAVQFNLKFLAVAPSGLRCVVSVHVTKTKQKKSKMKTYIYIHPSKGQVPECEQLSILTDQINPCRTLPNNKIPPLYAKSRAPVRDTQSSGTLYRAHAH